MYKTCDKTFVIQESLKYLNSVYCIRFDGHHIMFYHLLFKVVDEDSQMIYSLLLW